MKLPVKLPVKQHRERSAGRRVMRRRLTYKELLIVLLPCAAALLAALVVIFTVDRGSRYTFQQSAKQYYGGSISVIAQGTKLKRTAEGTLHMDSGALQTSCLPAYLDGGAVVLTGDMLCYSPRSGGYGKLYAFSELQRAANGLLTVTHEKQSLHPEAGFLYDGGNLYLFLEPVCVSCMGYTIDLSALSYAEVVNGGHVMLFDYATKEFFLEKTDGAVIAQTPDGAYEISLLGDSMTDKAGERTLLATHPEVFEPLGS